MSFFISLSTGYTVELIGAPESPLPSLPRPLQSSCSQTWCLTDLLTSDMHPRLKLGRLGFCILFTFKSSVQSKEVLSVLVIWVTDSVEHRYKQTYIYSKVLDIINEIVYPSNCKIFGEKPWYIETSLPVYPLTFHYVYIEVPQAVFLLQPASFLMDTLIIIVRLSKIPGKRCLTVEMLSVIKRVNCMNKKLMMFCLLWFSIFGFQQIGSRPHSWDFVQSRNGYHTYGPTNL